jgi:hypothetical protein
MTVSERAKTKKPNANCSPEGAFRFETGGYVTLQSQLYARKMISAPRIRRACQRFPKGAYGRF